MRELCKDRMTTIRDDEEMKIRRLILRYHHGQSIQSRTPHNSSPSRRLSQSRSRVSPKGHGHLALQKERLIDEDNCRSPYHRSPSSSRKRQLQQDSPQSNVTGSDVNEENNSFPMLPLWCQSDRYASLRRPRSHFQHGIISSEEKARHITNNTNKTIERRSAHRRSSLSQFRTPDDMTHVLAPRFDVWMAFTISSCATTLYVIRILLDSRMYYDDDVPSFTAMDALYLLTCSLSFFIGAVISCGVHFTPFRNDVTKSIFKTIDWGKFEEYRGQYRRDAFIGKMNLTAECIALTILFFLWIISIPFIVNRDKNHYSIMDGIEGEMSGEILWRDNLFYSSWISVLLVMYLWIEVCTLSDRSGTIELAELRHFPSNTFTKRWTFFLFLALVVFIASITAYTGPVCQGSLLKSTSYCSNLLMGIVMGGLFQLFLFIGVAVLYRLSNMRRRGNVDERIVSLWLRDVGSSFAALGSLVVQGFTVALLTSSTGGPANASEMLYFGSWLGFVLSIEVCMRYSELHDTYQNDTFVKAGRNRKRGMTEEDETVYEGEEYADNENHNPALKKERDYERRNNRPGLIDDVIIPKQKQKSFVFPDTVTMIPVHQQKGEIDKSFTTFSSNSTPLRPLTIERYVVPPTKLSTASKVKNNNDIWRKGITIATSEQQSETKSVDVKCSTMKVNNFRRPISPLTSDDSSTRIRQLWVEENTTFRKPLLSVATESLALDPSQCRRKNIDSSSKEKRVDVMLKANRELLVSSSEFLNAHIPPPIQRTQRVFRGQAWSPISSMSRPSSSLMSSNESSTSKNIAWIMMHNTSVRQGNNTPTIENHMSSNESSLDEDRDGVKTKNIAWLMMHNTSERHGNNTPTIENHKRPW